MRLARPGTRDCCTTVTVARAIIGRFGFTISSYVLRYLELVKRFQIGHTHHHAHHARTATRVSAKQPRTIDSGVHADDDIQESVSEAVGTAGPTSSGVVLGTVDIERSVLVC
jgi:hypothetical protein